MSAQAEDHQISVRRPRKGPRKSTGTPTSQGTLIHNTDLSADNALNNSPAQPIRILRRGEEENTSETATPAKNAMKSPQTPARPRSMYESLNMPQSTDDGSASETPPHRKKAGKGQQRKQSSVTSPKGKVNGTPMSAPRRESLTPNRANVTPSKAYAGPSFHASPAPSSLPMPRFFSKSVPNVDKTSSLQTMLEQETSAQTAEHVSASEASASPLDGDAVERPNIPEESPLDIFFRADRAAKSRTESAPSVSKRSMHHVHADSSPSRPATLSRNHSNSSTVGGLFALEMDGAKPEGNDTVPRGSTNRTNEPFNHTPTGPPLLSSPSNADMEGDYQRKMQALALKKLLHSPKVQAQSTKTNSTTTGQRPSTSKLREEVCLPNSPDCSAAPELPATPTPRHGSNNRSLVNGYMNNSSRHQAPYAPSLSEVKPQQDLQHSFTRKAINTQTMEDDLRRILKLDVLKSTGVTGMSS